MLVAFKNIRKKLSLEFLVSLVAIIIFFTFSYYIFLAVKKNSTQTSLSSYHARFNDIDGISIGSEVKLAGYKVGSVTQITVMPESYDVEVVFSVAQNIKLPTDSTVAVRTSGLFGGKFISVIPGAQEEFLENGEEVIYTQSSISLENIIGTFVNK